MALGETFGAKVGPLPVWGWAAIGGVGLAVLYLFLKKKNSGFTSQSPQSVTLTPNGGTGGVGGSQQSNLVCADGTVVTDLSQCKPAKSTPTPVPVTTPNPTQFPIATQPPVVQRTQPILPFNQPSLNVPVPQTLSSNGQAVIAQQSDAALYQRSYASPSPSWSQLGSGTPATQFGLSPQVQAMQLNSRIPGSALLPSTPQESAQFYNLAPISRQAVPHVGPGGVVTQILPR